MSEQVDQTPEPRRPFFYHYIVSDGTEYDQEESSTYRRWLDYIQNKLIKVDGVMVPLFNDFISELQHSGVYLIIERERELERLAGVTFAFDVEGNWNFAVCSKPDVFSRKKGR
jgi:hypothetical protein